MSSSPLHECRVCSPGAPRGLFLGEGDESNFGPQAPIPRRPESEPSSLSFAQERIWLLEQLQPGSYLTRQFAIRLSGSLDVSALEAALNTLRSRHEILRSCFRSSRQGSRQLVIPACEIRIPVVDLMDWPEGQREGVAARLAEHEGAQAFDLYSGPMLRTKLLRLRKDDHLLVFSAHHIVMDASSEALFLDELLHLYRGDVLPELPIQYADFSEWQRSRVQGRLFNRELRYWKNRLEGAPVLLELPTDRLRPAVKSYRGGRLPFRVGQELASRLRAIGHQEDCTLFMMLLAAFQILVHRYTGSDDVVIGAPLVNRDRREVEGLIGCLANTVALRTGMSGNPTFRELLSRVRRTVRGALAHQELPFEKLVEKLELKHDPSFAPLFQILFDFDSVGPLTQCATGLEVTPFEIQGGGTEFDLTLHLRDNGESLEGWFEYATDLFERCTIERLAGHYERLLTGIVSNPQERLSSLPLLTSPEREWQHSHFERTTAMLPPGPCVHELIREQASIRPEAIAVECAAQQLTYAELDLRSDRLLRILSALDIGTNDIVAVCLDRSLELPVALLGILKAGAAYLPIDPDTPEDRLVRMLRQARPRALLTIREATRNLAAFCRQDISEFGAGCELPMIYLDAELWDGMDCDKSRRPWSCAGPDELAFVVYTEDPTGDLRGVQIPHRALANLIESLQEQPGVHDRDTLLAVTPISSGVASVDLLLPLAAGAKVVLAPNTALSRSTELRSLCERVHPTIMQGRPTLWRSLLEAGWQGDRTLKILCGGAAWSEDLAEQLLRLCGSLWNAYGAAEAAVWSAISKVEPSEPLTIGSPIVNTSLYILDPCQQPVPAGIAGELYIGGDGVALGYLRQPEANARAFVADSFRPDSRGRLFRTGDRARYTSDGRIELLGRIEFQPKVRGFHVQLRAIEAVLRSHPCVAQTLVAVREDLTAAQCLVAYVVPASGQSVSSAELQQFLRHALPEYMVPSAIITMSKLPVLSDDRICRENLPAFTCTPPIELTNTRTELEKRIQAIWREILGTTTVGLHDDFFDLGGHTVLMMRMQQRLRDELGRELPIHSLFQHTTVSRLSDFLEGEKGSPGPAGTSYECEPTRAQTEHRQREEKNTL